MSIESSHLVIFSTSGKFITKFNVLRCVSLSETLFWTGVRGRIPTTLRVSEHEMLSFSIRKQIIENDNSLVVILLSKVGENEFLQTL